jgi:hypothetical protein
MTHVGEEPVFEDPGSEPFLAGEPVQVAQRTFVEGELLEVGQLPPFAVSNLPALEGSVKWTPKTGQ